MTIKTVETTAGNRIGNIGLKDQSSYRKGQLGLVKISKSSRRKVVVKD